MSFPEDLITIPLEFFALGPYTTDVLGVMGRQLGPSGGSVSGD